MLVRYTPYRQHRAADTGGTGDFGKRRARGGAVNTCCPLVAAGVVAMVVVGAFVVPATTGYRSALQEIRNSVSPPPPPSLPPPPSPPPSPGTPPPPPSPPPEADACTAADNICDDWSQLAVVDPFNNYWFSYGGFNAHYSYAEEINFNPGYDHSQFFPDAPNPWTGGNLLGQKTPNFNNNDWCEDGMGAPKGLTGKYQMPDQGYYIHMGRDLHKAGCGHALNVGTREYRALANKCLFFYVPCPNGGDCDDCGRAQSAGSGDGVTYLASPQQTAGPTGRRLATEDTTAMHLPRLNNASIIMEVVRIVQEHAAKGVLIDMRMPPLFHALVNGTVALDEDNEGAYGAA